MLIKNKLKNKKNTTIQIIRLSLYFWKPKYKKKIYVGIYIYI